MHFLFPQDPRGRDQPEDFFEDQAAALHAAGFTVSLLGGNVLRRGTPLAELPSSATVVYRGWMLNAEDYHRLAVAVSDAGGTLFTSPTEYLMAHHLPNWYSLIADLTPETRIYSADEALSPALTKLGWNRFFIKDFVKSLKTSAGSIIDDPAQIDRLLAEMKGYRGEIEGGVCVRQVEDFLTETERRYFVIHGRAYSPEAGEPVPEIVTQCAKRIPSRYFSVDVVQRRDGFLRVVEVGDGQVSDLVGWSATAFAHIWLDAIASTPVD